jgi:type IV secretion system protein VirB9
MYGIRFRYPQQARALAAAQTQMARFEEAKAVETNVMKSALDHAVIEGKRNFRYTEQGPASLQPSEVSDNGEFTVMRFPAMPTFPRSSRWTWTGRRQSCPTTCAMISW